MTPQPAATPKPPAAAPEPGPNEVALGLPIYPNAQFLHAFEAGRNQTFYVFGTLAPFREIVVYYKTRLKKNGAQLFEAPATWVCDLEDRREFAFPVGVTVRDHSVGTVHGYPNHRPGGSPAYFPTVIVITSWPGGTPPRKK